MNRAAEPPLEWELQESNETADFTSAVAYLQSDSGRVRVGDYKGSMLDGLPHGVGRFTLRGGACWSLLESCWAGQMRAGKVNGLGILTAEGSTYVGTAVSSGEHVVREGCGRFVPAKHLRGKAIAALWYDNEVDLTPAQGATISSSLLISCEQAAADAETAANTAANALASAHITHNHADSDGSGSGSSKPSTSRGDSGSSSGGTSTRTGAQPHSVCKLFRLRRLLPDDHAEQAPGKRIELLERAIARRPENQREVRDATAQLLHAVSCAYHRNRKAVRAAQAESAQTNHAVDEAQSWLEIQETWIMHQNVGPDLYVTLTKALMKQRGVARGQEQSSKQCNGAHTPRLTTEDIVEMMQKARLSGKVEVSWYRNDSLAQRGANRQALKQKAQADELVLAHARLKKLLTQVAKLKSDICELEEQRAARKDLEERM